MPEQSRLLSVVGARPQFIKAAPVCRALAAAGLHGTLVHTGQHYDESMSDVFFRELDLPPPDYHLGINGGSHGEMTGAMLPALEQVILVERPHAVVVYGDTNSTMAAALAASKLNVPVAHVEAGLRSRNRAMPEEINRIVTDHVSSLWFCSSETGVANLAAEGIRGPQVHVPGDIMADVFAHACGVAGAPPIAPPFALLTLHRAGNTDDKERLLSIIKTLGSCAQTMLFPVHPRTGAALDSAGIALPPNIRAIDPLGYQDMIAALRASEFVVTDSGGLQKEAYWAAKPCITLRDETEWVETVSAGWNILTGADPERIIAAMHSPPRSANHPVLYGDGQAAPRIAAALGAFLAG